MITLRINRSCIITNERFTNERFTNERFTNET